MGSVNKAILVGNLGRDAEMRFTAGGTPVATVSLATTERYTDREGQKRERHVEVHLPDDCRSALRVFTIIADAD